MSKDDQAFATTSESAREEKIVQRVSQEFVLSKNDIRDIEKNLKNLKTTIAEKNLNTLQVVDLITEILNLLEILWQNNITYNNLSPDSIYTDDNLKNIKLCNFQKSLTFNKEIFVESRLSESRDDFHFISPEQTGRMNRSIDFRSDIYSLGALMYYLLTKKYIFNETTTHRLAYCHLAKNPNIELGKNVEQAECIEEVILKMLKKDAEDRYQSSYAIKYDLGLIKSFIERQVKDKDFSAGSVDSVMRFHVSEKIVGREKEIEVIFKAYQKIVYGRSRLVLVAGQSGVGKTALVNEVRKPITEHNGNFYSGKFDQMNKKVPYSSAIQALNSAIEEMLISNQRDSWIKKIEIALGSNLSILLNFFPNLREIFKNVKEHKHFSNSKENQNLLNSVFSNLITTLKKPQYPLVLFLDDLQWADNATISLIHHLMTDVHGQNLLLICGYRDNEVPTAHPFSICVEEIRALGGEVDYLYVDNLKLNDVERLIELTFKRNDESVKKFSETIFNKTGGNSFYVKELLRDLYVKGYIKYLTEERQWHFDLDTIKKIEISENLMILLINKLGQLSRDELLILQVAATVGARFDIYTLSKVTGFEMQKVFSSVKNCMEKEYFIPLDKNYKYIDFFSSLFINASFKFSHDKIQQAGYETISPETKIDIHYKIFQDKYSEYKQSNEFQGDIFELAYHLDNAGSRVSLDVVEKVEIFFAAGKKAYEASSYTTALSYFEMAVKLLKDDFWLSHYQLTLRVFTYLADCYYVNAKTQDAEKVFNLVLDKSKSKEDKAKIYEIQMNYYTNQGRADEAIAIAVKALKLYGIKFPRVAKIWDAIPLLIKIKIKMFFKKDEDIFSANLMTDADAISALKILSNVSPSCFIQSPESMLTNCLLSLDLTLRHGNSGVSTYALSLMGFVEAVAMSNYKRARELMILATRLNEKLEAKDYEAKVLFAWHNFVQFYHSPIKESIPWLQRAHDAGVLCGDFNFASYSLYSALCREIYIGESLPIAYHKAVEYSSFADKINDKYIIPMMQIMRVYLSRMSGEVHAHYADHDKGFSADKMVDELAYDDLQNRSWLHIFEAMHLYATEDYYAALQTLKKCQSFVEKGTQKQIVLFEYYFYFVLSAIASAKQKEPLTFGETRELNKCLNILKEMADVMPENFRSRYFLARAKYHSFVKPEDRGQNFYYYQEAINYAKLDGFKLIETMSMESFYRYCLKIGHNSFAENYLEQIISKYQECGVPHKVDMLLKQKQQKNLQAFNQIIDLDLMMKMSDAISSERNLDSLVQKVIDLSISFTSSSHGYFFKREDSREVNSPWLIIDYVANTKEIYTADDISQSLFSEDPYFKEKSIRSLMAIPLLVDSSVQYVLVLVHDTSRGIYNSDKKKYMSYIASLLNLSLENAIVFDSLEKTVKERTDELKLTLDAKESLVRILCHDLSNLLQITVTSLFLIDKSVQDKPEGLTRFLEKIRFSTKQQIELVEHVRQMEALRSGKLELKVFPESVKEMLETSVKIFETQFLDKKIKLNINYSEMEDLNIFCEKTSFVNNVLNNIVSNALKFSKNESEIDVVCSCDSEYVYLKIIDHGIGMPEKILSNLFSKVAKTSRVGVNGEVGTGFGMPLMKTYLELMNGNVTVYSTEYSHQLQNEHLSGTTFLLKLPRAV